MTEDIPEITSSDMANLPIFIAVLIVAPSSCACIFQSNATKSHHCPRLWCATLLIRSAW
ncbi:MAG: hypothetical protein ACLU37_01625 [Collinsella sp.]